MNHLTSYLTHAETKHVRLTVIDMMSSLIDQAVSQIMSQAFISFLRPAGKPPYRHLRPCSSSLGRGAGAGERRGARVIGRGRPKAALPTSQCLLSLLGRAIRAAGIRGVVHARPACIIPANVCSDACPCTLTRARTYRVWPHVYTQEEAPRGHAYKPPAYPV